jgi:hypothetical protein
MTNVNTPVRRGNKITVNAVWEAIHQLIHSGKDSADQINLRDIGAELSRNGYLKRDGFNLLTFLTKLMELKMLDISVTETEETGTPADKDIVHQMYILLSDKGRHVMQNWISGEMTDFVTFGTPYRHAFGTKSSPTKPNPATNTVDRQLFGTLLA